MLKNRNVQLWSRRLHVYVSMALLLVVLFFAITGITLNRPHLFVSSEPMVNTSVVAIPAQLMHSAEGAFVPSRDRLLQFLADHTQLSGTPSQLSVYTEIEEGELLVGEIALDYKGPGYNAAVFIDMQVGEASIETTDYGVIAMLNDLHKGRNSGEVWRWFIDITAVLMVLFVLTGVCLLVPKKKTLTTSLKWLALGSGVTVAIFYFAVP